MLTEHINDNFICLAQPCSGQTICLLLLCLNKLNLTKHIGTQAVIIAANQFAVAMIKKQLISLCKPVDVGDIGCTIAVGKYSNFDFYFSAP